MNINYAHNHIADIHKKNTTQLYTLNLQVEWQRRGKARKYVNSTQNYNIGSSTRTAVCTAATDSNIERPDTTQTKTRLQIQT